MLPHRVTHQRDTSKAQGLWVQRKENSIGCWLRGRVRKSPVKESFLRWALKDVLRLACGGRGKCKWGKLRQMGKRWTSLGNIFGSGGGETGGHRGRHGRCFCRGQVGVGREAAEQRGGGTHAGPREASGLVRTLARPGCGDRGRVKDPAPGRVRVLGSGLILAVGPGCHLLVTYCIPERFPHTTLHLLSLQLLPGGRGVSCTKGLRPREVRRPPEVTGLGLD